MRLAGWAAEVIGMRLRVRGQTENLRSGEIFLFNHFTRIETTVPPFLLWRETGAFARSVTHHGLYHVHKVFRKFLLDTGCVPSDLPNLLPYLAAEVLRGRKVVIFPEGGLIKDKKVFDDRGHYAVKGADNRAPRPHHRGAAVLAVYLDIFKAHIRDANVRGDTATLAHWVAELNLPDIASLLAVCSQPTRVVPSTLTFFPLRNEPNWLVRILEMFTGQLSDRVRDELIMETNLLLRQTDLDLHIGTALPIAWTPPKAEAMLWRHALRNVTTLEQLFALDLDHAQWLHGPLAHRAHGAVETQRDRAMRALYGGLTVNLNHVLATLIDEYHSAGQNLIPTATFEAALLFAVQRLQEQAKRNSALPLHPSVAEALSLSQLAQGTHHGLQRMLESLRRAHLVKKRPEGYACSQRLDDPLGHHEIRLENPVRLHVNEAATQPAVRLAVMWGIEQAKQLNTLTGQQAWAGTVLQALRGTAREAYAAAAEAALPAGADALQPYLLKPTSTDAPATGIGVLLLHGLGATPAQGRPLAEELRALGYTVHGLRLPGHGGRPEDLRGQTEHDWLATTSLGLKLLQAQGARHIVILGFSTGALVALRAAKLWPERVAGVVALAPALQLVSPLRHLLNIARVANALLGPTVGRILPFLHYGVYPWYHMRPAYSAEQYPKVPLGSVAALVRLAQGAWREAASLAIPVHVLHGSADLVANQATSRAYTALLPQGVFTELPGAGHDVLRTNTAHSWARILQAVQSISLNAHKGPDHA
jgi:alpha-beta hydrolase superfamily lysophospholipase/1-acyl-sn-glycerol-3-phosphate acyltransferase